MGTTETGSQADAEFYGGCADGEVRAVPRDANGGLQRTFVFSTFDPKANMVMRYVYRLRADVGPMARYDLDTVEPIAGWLDE